MSKFKDFQYVKPEFVSFYHKQYKEFYNNLSYYKQNEIDGRRKNFRDSFYDVEDDESIVSIGYK